MIHKSKYIASMLLIEKTYKYFLNLVKLELEFLRISDINNIQALLLYQVGINEINMAELMAKGYYAGSNASYNIKKMVEAHYIDQTPSKHDKRSSVIKLTDKGLNLLKKLDQIFTQHSNIISERLNVNEIYENIKMICSEINNQDITRRDIFFMKKNIEHT